MNAFANAQSIYENMAPEDAAEPVEMSIDDLCDYIGEQWVRDGGDLELFRYSIEAIANRIEMGDEGATCIDYCAQYWREHGGDADGFRRNTGNIMGWIVSHMAAYGRIKN